MDNKDFNLSDEEETSSGAGATPTPIRQLLPGDIIDVVRKMRQLITALDTAGFTLYAGFEQVGDATLEDQAVKTRRSIELAASRTYDLLLAIEKTPNYQALRAKALGHVHAARAASGQKPDLEEK